MTNRLLLFACLSLVLTLQSVSAQENPAPCYTSSVLKMNIDGEQQIVTLKLAFAAAPGGDRRLIVADQTGRQITASALGCFPGPSRLCRLEDDNGEFHLKQLDNGRMELVTKKSALQVESYAANPNRMAISTFARSKDETIILNRQEKSCPDVPLYRPPLKSEESPPPEPPSKSNR